MGSIDAGDFHEKRPSQPWVVTPCTRSAILSMKARCNIYLKLDNLQPSGSFKSRGIGNMMQKAITSSSQGHSSSSPVHFYCASAGNAGLACATAAASLKRPATIAVPESTPPLMVQRLRNLGAEVIRVGLHWSQTDKYLREELVARDRDGVYVPPFDHPDIWEGNSSIIDELEAQMHDQGGYDAVVCSVGGGGLLCGIMQGLERHGRLEESPSPCCPQASGPGRELRNVRIMAVETEGAESLALSLRSKRLSRLPAITSIATSLGVAQVAAKALECAQRPEVISCVFPDLEACMGCVHFADDERILLEPACGVSVATAYNGTLHQLLFPELDEEEFSRLNIVIVVCGGSNITLEIMDTYRARVLKEMNV